MSYSFAGMSLKIDLTSGKIEKFPTDSNLARKYLGGRGTITKLFWDNVPSDTPPFSPDNYLIFGAGILTGTMAPGANRTALVTKSPVNNMLTYSTIGGFWGAELKNAGYDIVMISGKSEAPVFLHIEDDTVRIRPAGSLWGKDVRETQRTIRTELSRNDVQILSIGPAGENRVYFASIEHSYGAGASRAGVGAVMGAKNLKAIVVRGTNDLNIARPVEFQAVGQHILTKTDGLQSYFDQWSHQFAHHVLEEGLQGYQGTKQSSGDSGQLHAEYVQKRRTRMASCFNCMLACKDRFQLPDGNYSFVKCYTMFVFVLGCKIRDFTFGLTCYNLCERYGLDCLSTSNCVAFAMQLFEKGILSPADTGGLDLTDGGHDTVYALMDQIARRKGIGAVLADGTYKAAHTIGEEAVKQLQHIKKMELNPFSMYTPHTALRASVSDRADSMKLFEAITTGGLKASREWKKAYLDNGFFSYPDDTKKLFMQDYIGITEDYKTVVPFTSYSGDKHALADCSGLCTYWTGFWLFNPINLSDHVGLISTATGVDLDENEALEAARRVNAMTRAYNILNGIGKTDDTVPDKYFTQAPDPPHKLLDRNKFKRMVAAYYRHRNWNREGIPERAELDRLGLQDIRVEFERRGMY